jgi:hypothetical protein
MLEMLSLGKAVHVVPRTRAEQVFARRFMDSQALLGLGLETLAAPASDQIRRCELRGPQLIDGKGCQRIATEIEALV